MVEELTAKYLGKPLKFKKRKDPALPKKPLSGYLFFCKDNREKLKKKNPDLKMTDLSKKLGQLWSKMSEKKKKPYVMLHEKDKIRYEEEFETYMNNKDY